jgi:hypothetical protein
MVPQAFTVENVRIIHMSPLRQWLIDQLDHLLCPGGGRGSQIRINTHPGLFKALTGLDEKAYNNSLPSMTCCTSFVARVYTEAIRAGGLTVVPKGQPLEDKIALKYLPSFRMGDLGGDGPSSALRAAGCVYTWKKDPNGGPEPGDVYYVRDEQNNDKHIGFVRQYLRGGMYETYDGGLSHVNDGITFSEAHNIPEDRLWWLDVDAAMNLLGVWSLQPQKKPVWAGATK